MKAGFYKIDITPAAGLRMSGFGQRDREKAATGAHDPLFARALYLEQAEQKAVILALDLLFLAREEVDRIKGAIGREMDMTPAQILINTSHTHAGPKVDRWIYDPPPDELYLQQLQEKIIRSITHARQNLRSVTISATMAKTSLPMNRRRKRIDNTVEEGLKPNPQGPVCNSLPICLLRDNEGKPVCLLFSVSCHPSTTHEFEFSADFPGPATEIVDDFLGYECSLFLQGCGGDAKSRVIGEGEEEWRLGTWADVEESGRIVAEEVIGALEDLKISRPDLQSRLVEMYWPLHVNRTAADFYAIANNNESDKTWRLFAEEKIKILQRGGQLPVTVPVILHGLKIADQLRFVGLEGEAVAELGLFMVDFYKNGVTFPLGYTDGTQLYLTTDDMIAEGGYEVTSYYQYRIPYPLAGSHMPLLRAALSNMKINGID